MAEKSSSDGENNFDSDAKPFKKAKYAWQIKGRAKFKSKSRQNRRMASIGDKAPKSAYQEPCSLGSSSDNPSCNEPGENLCDAPVINDCSNCDKDLEEKKAEVVKILTGEKVDVDIENQLRESPINLPREVAVHCVDEFVSTLNRTNNLRKWQTKQIAKAIIDNAVNKVLEDMGFIPLPADAFDFHLVDSPSESDISPQNIESKGVSEAIRQQGLHRRSPQAWIHSSEGQAAAAATANHPSSTTTCTCWLHWKADGASTDTSEDSSSPCNQAMEELPEQQETVLDAALSFAISEKGLGMLSE